MDQQSGVMEGFLCPICIIDLKSPVGLSSHFEEVHADDKVVQQFKSVISKAKRKLLKENNDTSASTSHSVKADVSNKVFASNGRPETGGIDLALWERQRIGSSSSHTQEFCGQRKDAIEGIVVETNKLIIRLEKLIKSGIYASPAPSSVGVAVGLKSKKAMEKRVVPWDSDDNAKVCVNCSKRFSMTNRRHHCRLCGKVICGECMDNLDMTIACGVLKLNAEKASLYIKTTDDNENESGLKVCDPCSELLVRQNKLIQDKLANSDLLQLYEKMQTLMREADGIQPKYLKMADSLNCGETEFNLEVATGTRLRLLKLYENIDALSKRIQHLGLEKEKDPSPQLSKLQRSVRQYASNYLTQNMFILPVLPTPDKYTEMLKQKASNHEQIKTSTLSQLQSPKHSSPLLSRTRNEGKIEGGRDPSINKNSVGKDSVMNGTSRTGSSKYKPTIKELRPIQAVSISKTQDSSWGPVQAPIADHSSSVVSQQIQNVKGYLAQARQAGKQDEIKLFEDNLRELMLLERQQRGDS